MNTYYWIAPDGLIINSVAAASLELAAIGLPADATVVPHLTAAHRYAAAALEPEPLTRLAFLRRFSPQERIAIRGSTDPVIVDFLALLDLAQEVRVDDPDTVAAMAYLTANDYLGAGRSDEVLAA